MATSRYANGYPKIGIRPIIDRRKLIRASLEGMTMELARNVARMLESELRYTNGQPVECIVADTCISGAEEAARTAEKFAKEGVGVVISVASGWCYPLETMFADPTIPQAVWGFNGAERPGAVYLAALDAAHNQKGLPVFKIYGRDVRNLDDTRIPDDVRDLLLRFARAGVAVGTMKGKSYLSIGTVSMGIAGCIPDEVFFHKYLGMRVEYVSMVELARRIERGIYDQEEFQRAIAWVRDHCREGEDDNPKHVQHSRAQKDAEWEFVVKMALVVRDLMVGNKKLAEQGFVEEAYGRNAIAAGFQGQREWTDHYPNADFMEAILNSSFDWNGPRAPFIVATENDSLNAVSMLFGHLLTNAAQIFADVRTYWSPEAVRKATGYRLTGEAEGGIIHLINSGAAALDGTGQQSIDGRPAMKPFWEITSEEIERCLAATKWRPALLDQFPGGGFSTDFTTKGGMPVTICRINLVEGIGPVLQIAEGQTVELPPEVHDVLDRRTNPTWPTTWFVPRVTGKGPFKDVYSVMKHWGANHCAVSYGHIGAELITLASMLRIPVEMHNVEEERIFRPTAWDRFGSLDPQGADYRACLTYGPLYARV